jgi:hypothetical protein
VLAVTSALLQGMRLAPRGNGYKIIMPAQSP